MPESLQKEYLDSLQEVTASEYSEGVDGVENRYDRFPASFGSGKVKVLIFLSVLAVLAALTVAASQWKKGVVVRDIVIVGVSSSYAKDFSSSMNVYKDKNLLEIDSDEIKERVMQFPYVREALISKELNGIVRIKVVERVPTALTVLDGRVMAIDSEGFLLPGKKELTGRVPKFLSVFGVSRLKVAGNGLQQLDLRDVQVLREFLDALSDSAYASLLIREFHFEGNNMTYCIAAQSPTRFIVGNDGNFKEKLKKFEIFWQKVVAKKVSDTYETVDLRYKDRVFTTDVVSPQVVQDGSL
ncbi:MAG: FtsQ-type POTRA domain-containing protein [Chlorobiales bacterium]|nr:FtsQ-type POTRA domain-containing protein [Chlorobiales bacterium]